MARSLNRNIANKSSRGFTLLEVLIAMLIFGTTVAFLVRNLTEQQRAHTEIGLKTVAHWVAMNRMAEVRMQGQWPSTGVTRGNVEMRGKKWYWLQTVSKTTEKDLRQVEIEIRVEENEDNATSRFIGFVANRKTGEPLG